VNDLFILSSRYIKKLSDNINTLRLFYIDIDEIYISKIAVEVANSFLIIIDCR